MRAPTRALVTLLVLPLALVACDADSPTDPGADPGTPDPVQPPPPSRPPLESLSFTTPNTFFESLQTSVASNGSVTRTFTVSETTDFAMRYATDYTAQMVIMPADQAPAFEAFQGVSVVASWDGGAGTEFLTLAPGQYALGIRSSQPVRQEFSWELDYDIVGLPREHDYDFEFAGVVVSDALRVAANGGWAWQGFTIQSGFRYFLDGTNTRVDSWIIPEDQLQAFESGGSFQFFTAYEGTNAGAPGLWEVRLPPGTYYLAMRSNDAEVDGYVTFVLEAWRGY